MEFLFILFMFSALVAILVANKLYLWSQRYSEMEMQLGQLEDVDAEVIRRREQAVINERAVAARIATVEAQESAREAQRAARRAQLDEDFQATQKEHRRMLREIARVEGKVDEIDVGLYRAHYNLGGSVEYQRKLSEVATERANLFKTKRATLILGDWKVATRAKDIQKLQSQLTKLMLRAFNGESDTAIAKVTWKNITQMEERIRRSFETINALGATFNVAITEPYLEAVLAELRLEHELAERKRQEAEEQRLIREQMREEERVAREIERVQRESEADEQRYERAIEKARAEFERANAEQASAIQAKIALLETQLAEAHAKAERAKSMAQMTKVGHVYVVSNVGSFGEDVYKIGMTRRLEPMDRIKELGDASVPFDFDVHGMAWSEDAPALEAALHAEFDHRRVNVVNRRKEFFHLTLDELGEAIRRRGLKIELTLMAEAREFRESLAHRARLEQPTWRLAVPGVLTQDTSVEPRVPQEA